MTKNAKVVALFAIGVIALLVVAFIARDIWLGSSRVIACSDGERRTIDLRDFVQTYSAYSVEFEASFADKAKLQGKLKPEVIQQVSESLQQANEFRKFVVAGYNSCALSKKQYGEYGARFQAMDNLASQINNLTGKPQLSEAERTTLKDLTSQYLELSRKLGS